MTEARRFSRQTRFMLAGGATARPVHELDAVDRVCDELEALRAEAAALTARAEQAEQERDALRECARLQRRALVLLDTIESHWAENDEESVRHTSRFYEEARSALSEWEDANPALLAALREASA